MKKLGIIWNISTGKTTYCLQQKQLLEEQWKLVCYWSIDDLRRYILYHSNELVDLLIRKELNTKWLSWIILFKDESKMQQFTTIIIDRLIDLCQNQIDSEQFDSLLVEMWWLFHPKLYDLVDHNFVVLHAHPSVLDYRNMWTDLGEELLVRERYLSYRIGKFLCEAIEMRRRLQATLLV